MSEQSGRNNGVLVSLEEDKSGSSENDNGLDKRIPAQESDCLDTPRCPQRGEMSIDT